MTIPLVLTFAGLDPSGGAGIAADIRSMHAAGAHCLPVVTALTVQDTRDVVRVTPVAAATLQEQVDTLLADIAPAAIKVGLVAEPATAQLIRTTCDRLPGVPVVGDPVLRAGGGTRLADAAMIAAWRDVLLPVMTLATPNRQEFTQLFPAGTAPVLRAGQHLLVTGADNGGDPVEHRLLSGGGETRDYTVPRLPHSYHGSGCALAAAIAARLAAGEPVERAITDALAQVSAALRGAFRPGGGQWIPW